MSSVPEIAEREEALRLMLEGQSDAAAAEEARAGVEAARADREREDAAGILGPRELGFGLIRAGQLYDGGDWQELLFAVTDGEREAAIVARLSGSLVASLTARGEDVVGHAFERLRGAAGSLPDDGRRYENVLLHHPFTL
jgi:hypothetical protein